MGSTSVIIGFCLHTASGVSGRGEMKYCIGGERICENLRMVLLMVYLLSAGTRSG